MALWAWRVLLVFGRPLREGVGVDVSILPALWVDPFGGPPQGAEVGDRSIPSFRHEVHAL